MKFSAKKYSIQIKDFLKGLLMAAGTAIAMLLQSWADSGIIIFDLKQIAMAAIGAAATYIVRKYFVDDVKQAKKTIEIAKEQAAEEKSEA